MRCRHMSLHPRLVCHICLHLICGTQVYGAESVPHMSASLHHLPRTSASLHHTSSASLHHTCVPHMSASLHQTTSDNIRLHQITSDNIILVCHICLHLYIRQHQTTSDTANPTCGDIFESSKLERLFCHVSVKWDVRALRFELWNSIRKCNTPSGIGCTCVM